MSRLATSIFCFSFKIVRYLEIFFDCSQAHCRSAMIDFVKNVSGRFSVLPGRPDELQRSSLDDKGQIIDDLIVVNEYHFLTGNFPFFIYQYERMFAPATVHSLFVAPELIENEP